MLNQSFFSARRAALFNQMDDNSAAIVFSADEKTRSNDTQYHFRQDSTFLYFTGFSEPESVLVLIKKDDEQQTVLFNRTKDELQEIWHGRRLGQEGAVNIFEIDQALPVDELSELLPELIASIDTLYHDFSDGNDEFIEGLLSELDGTELDGAELEHTDIDNVQAPSNINNLRLISDEMRLFKQPEELAVMRRAAKISCEAHTRAMTYCAAGKFEYQLEAEILHHFAMSDARFAAYNTIVGGGENACILHYTENESILKGGDLVLIDAGCELQGYAADITRTFPVNGVFSAEQKAIYELVLKAQLAAIDLLVPNSSIKKANDAVVLILTQGLVDLGILTGDVDQLIKDEAHREFYMHGLSHWLGIDVHDVGDYSDDEGGEGRGRLLQENMILTVEPGLYISDRADVDAKWHNIGVRIEDDLLITTAGNEVLTAAVVKTVDDIEALMRK